MVVALVVRGTVARLQLWLLQAPCEAGGRVLVETSLAHPAISASMHLTLFGVPASAGPRRCRGHRRCRSSAPNPPLLFLSPQPAVAVPQPPALSPPWLLLLLLQAPCEAGGRVPTQGLLSLAINRRFLLPPRRPPELFMPLLHPILQWHVL